MTSRSCCTMGNGGETIKYIIRSRIRVCVLNFRRNACAYARPANEIDPFTAFRCWTAVTFGQGAWKRTSTERPPLFGTAKHNSKYGLRAPHTHCTATVFYTVHFMARVRAAHVTVYTTHPRRLRPTLQFFSSDFDLREMLWGTFDLPIFKFSLFPGNCQSLLNREFIILFLCCR